MRSRLSVIQHVLLLLLLLHELQLNASAETPDTSDQFTEAQKLSAQQKLEKLFDEELDTDHDGKISRSELARRMSHMADAKIMIDIDEQWNKFNVSDDATDGVTWEMWAAKRVPAAAAAAAAEKQAAAEVQEAVEAAKKESGIDQLGIKVNMPNVNANSGANSDANSGANSDANSGANEGATDAGQLAVELQRDERRWKLADADSNGKLTKPEFKNFMFPDDSEAMQPAVTQETIERLDSDADGKLSMTEFLRGDLDSDSNDRTTPPTEEEKAEFKSFDTSGDGFLDAKELQAAMFSDNSDAAKDALYFEDADQLIARVDADSDGAISRDEAVANVEAMLGSAVTDFGDAVGVHDEL